MQILPVKMHPVPVLKALQVLSSSHSETIRLYVPCPTYLHLPKITDNRFAIGLK